VQRQWSQGELARRAGFETTTINRFKRGKANPTMALVIALAENIQTPAIRVAGACETQVHEARPDNPACWDIGH